MSEGKGTQQAQTPTERVEVSPGIMQAAAALEGLPGAKKIITELGESAAKEGLIKTVAVGEDDQSQGNDLAANPSTVKTPEIPLMRSEEGEQVNNSADGEKNNGTGKDIKNPDQKAGAAQGDSAEEVEDTVSDEEEEKNPLLKALGTKSKKTNLSFENLSQIKEHIKKDFGIDVKDDKDINKFFHSSKKWREDSAKLPEVEKKVGEFEALFNEMPAPLLNGIKAYFEGDKDWAGKVSKMPKFDFSKPATEQSSKALVNHYFPGKFKDEDFTAEEKSPALEIAIQASFDKFNADKREIEDESNRHMQASLARTEARKNSVSGSLASLKQSFPDVDKAEEKRLAKLLESGDIHSLFFNRDGSIKPDAAKRLFLAEYGEEAISRLMKVSAKRAESKVNEDILTRGADKPKPQKGGASNSERDGMIKKKIDDLTGGLNRKQTY